MGVNIIARDAGGKQLYFSVVNNAPPANFVPLPNSILPGRDFTVLVTAQGSLYGFSTDGMTVEVSVTWIKFEPI